MCSRIGLLFVGCGELLHELWIVSVVLLRRQLAVVQRVQHGLLLSVLAAFDVADLRGQIDRAQLRVPRSSCSRLLLGSGVGDLIQTYSVAEGRVVH